MNASRAARPVSVISDDDVALAIRLVDAAEVVGFFEAGLARSTGRQRKGINATAVLVGFVLAGLDGRGMLLTEVHEILSRRISPAMQSRLGVDLPHSTDRQVEASYTKVRRLFHAMLGLVDPSPLPKNHRTSRAEMDRLVKAQDGDERVRLDQLLTWLTGRIIESSHSLLPRDVRRRWQGATAVDGTPMQAWSRGVSKSDPLGSTDPDAAWWTRGGDHGYSGKTSPKRGKHGYEAQIAVMCPDSTQDDLPTLALGVRLHRPAHAPSSEAITMLADVRSRGHAAGWLVVDRLYNFATPDNFQLPAHAMGYKPLYDYRDDQLGKQAEYEGAVMVEGTWYCPSMPKDLVEATIDHRAKKINDELYAARIAGRARYAFRAKDTPDEHGRQRLKCPAASGSCTMSCSLKPKSRGSRRGLLAVDSPPTEPPKVCTQQTVLFPADAGAKHRQSAAYRSVEWQAHWPRLRSSMEGFNGFVKDPAHEALATAGLRRVRGIAAQSFFAAVQIAVANVRKILAWLAGREQPTSTPVRVRRPRTIAEQGQSIRDYLPPARGPDAA